MATSAPLPPVTAPPASDKVVHLIMYAVLAFLSARALREPAPARRLTLLVAAISAFGVVDELHQRLIPGRSADVHDWVADTAGAAAGATAAWLLLMRREARVP